MTMKYGWVEFPRQTNPALVRSGGSAVGGKMKNGGHLCKHNLLYSKRNIFSTQGMERRG